MEHLPRLLYASPAPLHRSRSPATGSLVQTASLRLVPRQAKCVPRPRSQRLTLLVRRPRVDVRYVLSAARGSPGSSFSGSGDDRLSRLAASWNSGLSPAARRRLPTRIPTTNRTTFARSWVRLSWTGRRSIPVRSREMGFLVTRKLALAGEPPARLSMSACLPGARDVTAPP